MRTGFYAGSFDPVTFGHIDIIERSARLVERLVIGIGIQEGKRPLFSAEERVEMLQAEGVKISAATGTMIDVVTFDGLVVNAARDEGASIILRGLRSSTDFAYEMPMAGMNGQMMPNIQTVFLPASPDMSHIASNLVRQIASMNGDVSEFVPLKVADRLIKKFSKN